MGEYILNKPYVSAHKQWSKLQSKSSDHKIAVCLYSILCSLGMINSSIAIGGPLVFFIITALTKMNSMLAYMLFSVAITTIASLINPVLGFIVSFLFFIMKISNFIKNWKAIFSGMFVYLLPYFIALGNLRYYIYICLSPINNLLYNFNLSHEIIYYANIILIGCFCGFVLHMILNWLYKNEYSAKSALATMGSAPLIILLIIIPFIINAVGDFIDDIMSASSSMADDFASFRYDYDTDFYDSVDLDGDGINDNIHGVRGHYRTNSNGSVTYVDPHIRTNPNSTITDNISYHK